MDLFLFFPKIVKETVKGLAKTAGSKQSPVERDSRFVLFYDHNTLVWEKANVIGRLPGAQISTGKLRIWTTTARRMQANQMNSLNFFANDGNSWILRQEGVPSRFICVHDRRLPWIHQSPCTMVWKRVCRAASLSDWLRLVSIRLLLCGFLFRNLPLC